VLKKERFYNETVQKEKAGTNLSCERRCKMT